MGDDIWRDEGLLRKLYVEQELSVDEISQRLACCTKTIRNWLKRHSIPMRSSLESLTLSVKNGKRGKYHNLPSLYLDIEEIKRLYLDEKIGGLRIAKMFGSTPSTIYAIMKKNGIPIRTRDEAAIVRFGRIRVRQKVPNGYIYISIGSLSESERILFKPMIDRKKHWAIEEHRLVMARMLNRPIRKDEVVHHLNGIKDDNRFENLILLNNSKHRNYIPALNKRIRELEKRIEQLESDKQLYLSLVGD